MTILKLLLMSKSKWLTQFSHFDYLTIVANDEHGSDTMTFMARAFAAWTHYKHCKISVTLHHFGDNWTATGLL